MTWDDFLNMMASRFELSKTEREIFLFRWSGENKKKPNTEIQQYLDENQHNQNKFSFSPNSYPKHKTEIFNKFQVDIEDRKGCKTLKDAGPQTGKRLLEWLEEQYHEWLQAHPELEAKTDRAFPYLDDIDWLRVCRKMWAKQREDQRIRRKVTERGFEVNVYVGLGLVQRLQQQRREGEMDRDEIFALTDTEAIAHTYEHDRFLDEVMGQEPRGENRHIAIIGEPGAGKSTLLAAIANYLTKDESKIMPICLSLASLQGKTIKDYLLDIWLSEALKLAYPEIAVVEDSHKISFQQWLRQGQVWLLLDGMDEISDRTPAEVQNDIKNELTDWLGYVRVALTCRLNVWDARLNNDLTGFDTYKTDKFKPDEIKKFIEDWFKQAKKPEAGQILQNKLDESKYTNLRGLVTNPLRLSLLCQVFYRNPNLELPETKAGLYKIFVRNFYEDWKAEQHPITKSQQKQLNQALGELARAGLDNQYTFKRFRLPEDSAREVMTDELFELAKNLGWLNIVDLDVNDKAVYAFWHPTFQEYFAACAIDDWDDFLPSHHNNDKPKPIHNKTYRIKLHWREVILLWLEINREKISLDRQQLFIDQLINFNDGCGNFYDSSAYSIAISAIESEIDIFKNFSYILEYSVRYCKKHHTSLYKKMTASIRAIIPFTHIAFDYIDRRNLQNFIINLIQQLELDYILDQPANSLDNLYNFLNFISFLDNNTEHSDDCLENLSIKSLYNCFKNNKNLFKRKKALKKILIYAYQCPLLTISDLITNFIVESYEVQVEYLIYWIIDSPHFMNCQFEVKQNINIFLDFFKHIKNESIHQTIVSLIIKNLKDIKTCQIVIRSLSHYLTDDIKKSNLFLYHSCYKILWHCSERLSYPEFYMAWHNDRNQIAEQLEQQWDIASQLQPVSNKTLCYLKQLQILLKESDLLKVAKNLAFKIFSILAPNEPIPKIQDEYDLQLELYNLTISLKIEKIALIFDLRGLEINPDFKQSAFYEIALWLANSPKIAIAWISDAMTNYPLNIDPPMRGFTSEQDNLLEVLQNWLNDV